MNKIFKYATVCSGIGAPECAWRSLGWEAQWCSQYDPEWNYAERGPDFPSRVLAHRYPDVPNLGDMCKVKDNSIFNETDIDLLVGGTPCQSFSIAGLRRGLGDGRGNLALEFVRLLMLKRPRWFVWENVPGVLSSGGHTENYQSEAEFSKDFACILSAFTGRDVAATETMAKAGIIEGTFYSIAWRIYDSQYFGVPQRRRRVFVVGYLGNDWRPPVAVLFEQDSLRRDFTPGREAREEAARNSKMGVFAGNKWPAEVASTLDTTFGDKRGLDDQYVNAGCPWFVPTTAFSSHGFADYLQTHVSGTLKKDGGDLGGGSETLLAYGIQSVIINRDSKNRGNGLGVKEQQSPTLTKADRHAVCYAPLVASFEPSHYTNGFGQAGLGDISGTLSKSYGGHNSTHLLQGFMIRRLTPLEFERLQGFPDYYTLIPDDISGKYRKPANATDGHRYSAIGNSMTVQVMHHIGKRIQLVDNVINKLNHDTTQQ